MTLSDTRRITLDSRWDRAASDSWEIRPKRADHAGYVYVAWGTGRRPLYVGYASNLYRRIYQHLGRSGWAQEAVRFQVYAYATEDEAKSAELTAIAMLNPIHNRYRPPPPTREEWMDHQMSIVRRVQSLGRNAA